jgi:hypothetical protein
MLKITDTKFLFEIVADAIVQVHLNCPDKRRRNRWINAIAKAAATLEGDTTFLHWEPDQEILFYWSPESGEIYQTGDACGCPAYLQPIPLPCYHRAMRRLVKNYFEFQQTPGVPAPVDFADAVFFDTKLSARQKVELLNSCITEGRIELKPRLTVLKRHISSKPLEK